MMKPDHAIFFCFTCLLGIIIYVAIISFFFLIFSFDVSLTAIRKIAVTLNKNQFQQTFTCSNSTIETLEKGLKYVQS